jgi:hypothetical protein
MLAEVLILNGAWPKVEPELRRIQELGAYGKLSKLKAIYSSVGIKSIRENFAATS